MSLSLPLRHMLLAIAVTAVWGTHFVVTSLAPPLLLATLRVSLTALPAVAWSNLTALSWAGVPSVSEATTAA